MELYDVLDQIDQVIYLSDLDTHEIIFVNRYGKKQYGPVTPGVKCYEYLQGFDAPCAFCTNQRLREDPDHRYTWHRKLPGTGHLLLHDSIVTVNGRPCRMELAVNVSRYAHIFEAELSLATEQKLVECIDKLVLSDDFDAAMDQCWRSSASSIRRTGPMCSASTGTRERPPTPMRCARRGSRQKFKICRPCPCGPCTSGWRC